MQIFNIIVQIFNIVFKIGTSIIFIIDSLMFFAGSKNKIDTLWYGIASILMFHFFVL